MVSKYYKYQLINDILHDLSIKMELKVKYVPNNCEQLFKYADSHVEFVIVMRKRLKPRLYPRETYYVHVYPSAVRIFAFSLQKTSNLNLP